MPNVRKDQLWIGGGVLAAVLLIVIAWFAIIGPELSNAGSLGEQTTAAETQNATLQSKVSKLQADSSNMEGLNKQLRDARAALPVDSGLPDFTRQLGEQARIAGVLLTSISADTPTVAGAAPGAPAKRAPAAGKGAPPVAGSLFAVPVTVVAEGSLERHRAFLAAVEQQGPRRALIESVAFGAGQSSPTAGSSVDIATTMTVKLLVFVAPQTPAAQAELQKQLGG